MSTIKMILAALSALIFAATGEFTARADIGAAVPTTVIQPYPGQPAPGIESAGAPPVAQSAPESAAKSDRESARQAAPEPTAQAAPEPAPQAVPEPAPQAAQEPAPQPSTGQRIADYASQFIGNPYVYGGTSLTNGADCSGFVMKVYEQFGVQLPRTSRDQGRTGADVGGIENAQPGDIVSYRGHIGIYRGQNQLVHASSPESGIKISPVNYKPILSVRRVL